MKISNYWLLFFSLLFFLQCEVPYEDDARLLIKGQIVDENNQPIPNSEINVFIRRDDDFLFGSEPSTQNDGVFLGGANTKNNGTFSIITLLGKHRDFVVEIYGGEEYSKYMYRTNTEEFIPDDYLIDLETIFLAKKSAFEFNISRTSPIGIELQYNFEYLSSNCLEVYEEGVLNEEETFCYESTNTGSLLNDNRPDSSGSFISLLGSEVIFTYSINGQPEVTEILMIDGAAYEFNFSY